MDSINVRIQQVYICEAYTQCTRHEVCPTAMRLTFVARVRLNHEDNKDDDDKER